MSFLKLISDTMTFVITYDTLGADVDQAGLTKVFRFLLWMLQAKFLQLIIIDFVTSLDRLKSRTLANSRWHDLTDVAVCSMVVGDDASELVVFPLVVNIV